MRRPRRARISLVALAVSLGATPFAAASDALSAARNALNLPRTAEAMQARYDAGRNLEESLYAGGRGCVSHLALARGLVQWAEGYDRPLGAIERRGRRAAFRAAAAPCGRSPLVRKSPPLPRLPKLVAAAAQSAIDARLAASLALLGRAFDGWAAIWTHDLVSGRTAGWNSDARFPAASTVKLGVLLAALKRGGPAIDYDLRAMTAWSSNLAANRVFARIGGRGAVEGAMRAAGATRSTYPQGFRVGTALHALDVEKEPPPVSGRVTTAHDLGRMLYAIHSGAVHRNGRSRYALSLLLGSQPVGNNVGLFRPWVRPGIRIAQKNGWLHDARHTAAIVYAPSGPKIVVVLTYGPNLPLWRARELGRRVLRACLRS